MPPRLYSPYFADSEFSQWQRLARVLAFSAAKHCAAWDRQIVLVQPQPMKSALGIQSLVHNTQKMQAWADVVATAPQGTQLLLLDADTFIVRPLDDIWDRSFDFAFTTKRHTRFPFNSGVVFVRVTPAVRAFFEVWRAQNVRMLADRDHHYVWREKYGGINQASLGYALDHNQTRDLRLLELPCAEWNCEDTSWSAFDPGVTRIVHVKSMLRRVVFDQAAATEKVGRLPAVWRHLEAAAQGAPVGA